MNECMEARGKLRQEAQTEAKKLAALTQTLRRVCTPKKSTGRLEVSHEVYKQWKQGGGAT